MTESTFNANYIRKELPKKYFTIGIAFFIVGLILVVLAYFTDSQRASFNGIITLMFVASIGLGSLFLVALEYLAGAVWSVPFRRVSEILSIFIFVAPIIGIPLLLNLHGLFHWSHHDAIAHDKILAAKAPYLNESFFIIRFILIFVFMALFYVILISRSRKQDITANQSLTTQNIKFSAVFMPIFAISISLLAIDWLMSLEPHWFSTIFAVYYFSGSLLAALALLTFIAITLNEAGFLIKGLGPDHYYSLGGLLFAFTNFWAYIAFSQFMLIWYANLPEETFWYITRGTGSWSAVSIGLIFVRFVIPYVLLLSQPSKKDPKRLKLAAIWIAFAHLYDLYWLVMPNFSKSGAVFGWIEIGFTLFLIGLIIVGFNIAAKNTNLIPIGDPKLKRALEFHL